MIWHRSNPTRKTRQKSPKERKAEAMSSKVIFNCDEIVGACKGAKEAGKPLSTVFSISTSAHSGQNGTKYMDLTATVPGKRGRLMLRVVKEKHVGVIPPIDDAELARLNAEHSGEYGLLKKRNRHPTIQVQKYKERVATDEEGRPKGCLPPDDQKSPYFEVCQYLDEFFYNTMSERLDKGKIVLRDARRKEYPADAIVVPNAKVIPLYQSHVSMESKNNPGRELANPICRTNMKFDAETGMAKRVEFYDKTKRHRDAKTGKIVYEPLTFDGNAVTALKELSV